MNIIICGAGKVGEVLCRDLSREGHNVVLIEKDEKRLDKMIGFADITGIEGNGALYEVQLDAGVNNCDIFIAVTPDDETNIIAGVTAKKLGAANIIARVRSPEYSMQMDFLRESLGITLLINPEKAAAKEVSMVLQYPKAINIDTFASGKVRLVSVELPKGSSFAGKSLTDMDRNFGDVIVVAIERNEELIIPFGGTMLKEGDIIYATGEKEELIKFMNIDEEQVRRIRSALIVGGGRLTSYILDCIKDFHIHTKVIEVDPEKAEKLAVDYPQVEVLCGDGTSQSFLAEERIQNNDCVLSLTGIDEENLLISIYAAHCGVKKTVTKVNRTDLVKLLYQSGLQTIVTPYRVISEHITRFVRSKANSEGSNVEAFYRLCEGKAEALQFHVAEGSRVTGKTLEELDTKEGLIIAAILRENEVIYPSGRDSIMSGDEVVVVTSIPNFKDIEEILK